MFLLSLNALVDETFHQGKSLPESPLDENPFGKVVRFLCEDMGAGNFKTVRSY